MKKVLKMLSCPGGRGRGWGYTFLIFALASVIYSCEPDEDVTPGSIEGTWHCKENHYIHGEQWYYVDIENDPNISNRVLIYNFLGLNAITDTFHVYATLTGSTLNIPQQIIEGHTVSGQGTVADNYKTINLEYSDDDGSGEADPVTAVYTKQ